MDWAVSVLDYFKPTHFVLNGDLVDATGISKHVSGQEVEHDYLSELEAASEILQRFRKATPKTYHREIMLGNHEDRLFTSLNEKLPRYLRRAVQMPLLEGEFKHWRVRQYEMSRDGMYVVGPFVVFHGARSGAASNENEAVEILHMLGGAFKNRLVVLGHTHRVIQPSLIRKTKKIAIGGHHANCGSLCDPSKMEWTKRINTAEWGPGVGCFVAPSKNRWYGMVATPEQHPNELRTIEPA